MLCAYPGKGLCGAGLTKRSTSEIGLGATVVGVSLVGKPRIFSPVNLVSGRENMAGDCVASQPGDGKSRSSAGVRARQKARIAKGAEGAAKSAYVQSTGAFRPQEASI